MFACVKGVVRSLAGGAPLANLNCTRRGHENGKTNETILCASVTGSTGGNKKKEKKQETHSDESGRVNV